MRRQVFTIDQTVMTAMFMGMIVAMTMIIRIPIPATHGYIHLGDSMIFLAVMVADILLLDLFNSLGMPTSTTVSMVFELLGGAFILAIIKIAMGTQGADGSLLQLDDYLNSEKALSVIVAIFVSVAIAFVFGVIVQWLSRLLFTFTYEKGSSTYSRSCDADDRSCYRICRRDQNRRCCGCRNPEFRVRN
jgi:uncharacterized membrane protein